MLMKEDSREEYMLFKLIFIKFYARQNSPAWQKTSQWLSAAKTVDNAVTITWKSHKCLLKVTNIWCILILMVYRYIFVKYNKLYSKYEDIILYLNYTSIRLTWKYF